MLGEPASRRYCGEAGDFRLNNYMFRTTTNVIFRSAEFVMQEGNFATQAYRIVSDKGCCGGGKSTVPKRTKPILPDLLNGALDKVVCVVYLEDAAHSVLENLQTFLAICLHGCLDGVDWREDHPERCSSQGCEHCLNQRW
jgi:hypothetical protein